MESKSTVLNQCQPVRETSNASVTLGHEQYGNICGSFLPLGPRTPYWPLLGSQDPPSWLLLQALRSLVVSIPWHKSAVTKYLSKKGTYMYTCCDNWPIFLY